MAPTSVVVSRDPGSNYIRLDLQGSCGMTPDLVISPFTSGLSGGSYGYDFGSVTSIGTVQTFTVTNNGTGMADFLDMTEGSSDDFTLDEGFCNHANLGPGESCSFNVTAAPNGCTFAEILRGKSIFLSWAQGHVALRVGGLAELRRLDAHCMPGVLRRRGSGRGRGRTVTMNVTAPSWNRHANKAHAEKSRGGPRTAPSPHCARRVTPTTRSSPTSTPPPASRPGAGRRVVLARRGAGVRRLAEPKPRCLAGQRAAP